MLESFFFDFTVLKVFSKSLVEPNWRAPCRNLLSEVVAQFVIDDTKTLLVFFLPAQYDGFL